jgi:hypothetical protein
MSTAARLFFTLLLLAGAAAMQPAAAQAPNAPSGDTSPASGFEVQTEQQLLGLANQRSSFPISSRASPPCPNVLRPPLISISSRREKT